MSELIKLTVEEQDLSVGKDGAAWFGIWRLESGYWVIESDGRNRGEDSEKGATEPAARAVSAALLGAG